jgi:hypothetical protein
MIEILVALIFAHYILDYPLQGEFLSRAKNRHNPVEHVPWYQAMTAHTAMHGIAVGFITGVWLFAILEMAIHWWADDRKCQGELTFNQDQTIHIICKVAWAVGVVIMGTL